MRFWVLLIVPLCFASCNATTTPQEKVELNPKLPFGFDQPEFPEDNLLTIEKINLGKMLFFDQKLSKNQNISCASCHKPEFAFADTSQFSIGTNAAIGFRNTPSIINTVYKKLFHKDGGVRTLELQVLAPIIDTNELGVDFLVLLERLNKDTTYIRLFKEAFDTLPTVYGITRAITSYERSLIIGESRYDLYQSGDIEALSQSEIAGMDLFNSKKLNCIACHSGVLFTDFTYQNIGLKSSKQDSGRARVTYRSEDAGKFEVPSLRNVAVTAPYMHDGSISTLDEVIQYLEKGGGNHPNKSELTQPFKISDAERSDLVLFLESLTDERFKKN